ncbi:MAG TPA: 3-isopropylmalate dehydratase, partial [Ramlibacter sp.]|nr:3-isopropylmalate dehydratase [Ramlibacter sp.]
MNISLPGRILFLSADPELVRSQLEGRDLTAAEAGTLRDDVSTDEMTSQVASTVYDHRLGELVLTAYQAGGVYPIGRQAVRKGGFSVIVAGNRYGKGSSREHSPLAHLHAGIRLIVANSFERIFRQNCDNLGIFTTTDFGLIDRLQRGQMPPLDVLVAGRDRLAAELLRAGGLLKYGKA